VPAVVGEREVVLESCRRNPNIGIPNNHAVSAQPASLTAKDFGGLLIETHQVDPLEKLVESPFITCRITGVIEIIRI
jgi:hypothetical protein